MEIKSRKLEGKKIIYGITGSIASVEAIKIARELRRHMAEIVPVMTHDATKILHPHAFEFAAGNNVITEITGKVEHLIKADLMLIAPCTANTIAKIANGIADNALTTFAISNKKILIAPSMDASMYGNSIVKNNIKKCMKMGIEFIEPKISEGKAKMADMETIVEAVIRAIRKSIDKKLLVIGGNTMEPIDSVRAITNFSSGKMARAIAIEAYERVENVEAWFGNIDCPRYIKCKKFSSMEELVKFIKKARGYDAIINCAALPDFVVEAKKGKIPSGKPVKITLKPAPRINKMLRKITDKLIIFKLDEKKKLLKKAMERLKEDDADYVIANPIESIGSDETEIYIMDREGKTRRFKGRKEDVARHIVDLI